MRKFVIQAAMVALSLMGTSAFAAGLVDHDGIEASRAGIADRSASRHVSYLEPHHGSWRAANLDADRQHCRNHEGVLRTARNLFRKGQLTDERLISAVRKAGMPDICLKAVSDSEYPDAEYPVLITLDDDFVFGLDEHRAYMPWREVDHTDAMLDTIALDGSTYYGLAPAGKTDQIVGDAGGQAQIDLSWLASQAKEAAAKKRMEDISIPLPTPRPDPNTTGSID